MSKSTMLRTRRKDINVKPNRRLDRKSSRGMIYENEELRLRTININAEVEKGQSDIKKLRRENEQLRREIWCLRDEYEKLDKLLQNKTPDDSEKSSGSSGNSSDEESDDSSYISHDIESEETNQNHENVEKISNRHHNLHTDFDSLSVVTEEISFDKSDDNTFSQDKTSFTGNKNLKSFSSSTINDGVIIGPDQSYPSDHSCLLDDKRHWPRNFFAPLPCRNLNTDSPLPNSNLLYEKTGVDLYVNQVSAASRHVQSTSLTYEENAKFQTGGNLEELLQDMEVISNDILNITQNSKMDSSMQLLHPVPILENNNSNLNDFAPPQLLQESSTTNTFYDQDSDQINAQKPYKSEINVVLMPTPMPLIGFEKYKLQPNKNTAFDLSGNHDYSNIDNTTIAPFGSRNQIFEEDQCVLCQSLNSSLSAPYLSCTNCLELNKSENNAQSLGNIPSIYTPDQLQKEGLSGNVQKEDLNKASSLVSTAKSMDIIDSPQELVTNNSSSTVNISKLLQNTDDGNIEKLTSSSDDKAGKNASNEIPKSPGKTRKPKKLSIHFNGTKKSNDKLNRSLSLDCASEQSNEDTNTPSKTNHAFNGKFDLVNIPENKEIGSSNDVSSVPSVLPKSPLPERKVSLVSNTSSLDKKHVKIDGQKSQLITDKKHKSHEGSTKKRRKNSTAEKLSASKNRLDQKSNSVDIPRSRQDWNNRHYDSFNEFTSLSERERTNSLTSESSRNTTKSRKLSSFSQFNSSPKVPWCACWGNGCL